MLAILLDQTEQYFLNSNQQYLAVMYKAIFSASYFGLLRVGKVTSGTHPILAGNVHIAENKRKVLFILRTSKTHWKDSKPQFVKISMSIDKKRSIKGCNIQGPNAPLAWCPYALLREYVMERPSKMKVDEPFFVFTDKTPVSPNHMRKMLKFLLTLSGFNAQLYSTHSLRIGRCVDLQKMQIHVDLIRKLGRWRSNCVYRYLANI